MKVAVTFALMCLSITSLLSFTKCGKYFININLLMSLCFFNCKLQDNDSTYIRRTLIDKVQMQKKREDLAQ